MRCIKNFLCQFGIAGIPSETERYSGPQHKMTDDPNWLPEGPTHRTNELGVKRFAKGFLAYAGAGPNTRGVQVSAVYMFREKYILFRCISCDLFYIIILTQSFSSLKTSHMIS